MASRPKTTHAYFTTDARQLDDLPLSELGLPTRARNALQNGGIKSLRDILEWPVRELRALPNCGDTTIAAIRRILDSLQASERGASLQ